MRFDVKTDELKKLASRVGDYLPHAKYNQLLNVLAQGLGWRDWHELESIDSEKRSGSSFPIPINKALRERGSVADIGYIEYRQQMHEAFAHAFGETCPGIEDDTGLFALLDTLGFTDNRVQGLKKDRKGLPSSQVKSGYYALSLSNALRVSARSDDKGKWYSLEDGFGVKECDGEEIDPEESPVAFDPSDVMKRKEYWRWFETVTRHSFDKPVIEAGRSREPIFLVCEEVDSREQLGSLIAAWEVDCPHDAPHFTGTLEITAAASANEEVTWWMGSSLPVVVQHAVDSAVLGLAGKEEAQLTLRIVNTFPTKLAREIADTCYQLLSDREALRPCVRAGRARVELVERIGAKERVVQCMPAADQPLARLGPPLRLRRDRSAFAVAMVRADAIFNADGGSEN